MIDVDMIAFRGFGNGIVQDLWSVGYFTPSIDESDDLISPFATITDNKYSFTVERGFATGDSAEDLRFVNARTYTWAWVSSDESHELTTKHNHRGQISFSMPDCSASTSEAHDDHHDEHSGTAEAVSEEADHDHSSHDHEHHGEDGESEYNLYAVVIPIAVVAIILLAFLYACFCSK